MSSPATLTGTREAPAESAPGDSLLWPQEHEAEHPAAVPELAPRILEMLDVLKDLLASAPAVRLAPSPP